MGKVYNKEFMQIPTAWPDDTMVSDKDAPKFVGASLITMRRWRSEGKGPSYYKIGRVIQYKVGDLRKWIEQSRVER